MKYESTAKGLASLGRHGDTMLMHVNPSEVATLSKVLGPVTRNPHTGLPEAFGWGSAIGSILGGIGSFGVGAALEPVIGDMVEEGLLGNVLRKAIPALAGAGVGAAVGGATGGKAGAMGGAAQGLMSGGIGAYASNDLLGSPHQAYAPEAPTKLPEPNEALSSTPEYQKLGNVGEPSQMSLTIQKHLGQPDILSHEAPDYANTVNTMREAQNLNAVDKPGFFDNLGTIAHGAVSDEGFKKLEPYASPLFMSGMIGNTITNQQESNKAANEATDFVTRQRLLAKLRGEQLAREAYSGAYSAYAGGGPITMHKDGLIPTSVMIPEHMVEKVINSGGLSAFLQSSARDADNFATGGYVNTAPFSPQSSYPQAHILSAQPYAGAAPNSVVNTLAHGASFEHGGLIDGEGDGMSDDIDANIDGQEPVRVADGEYVVPKHIVEMLGPDRLDELLRKVRRASYGREDQINENAGLHAAKKELGI